MTEAEKIITLFYTAFQNKNAEEMVKYYGDNVVFSDSAFGTLQGTHAKNMWRMLCENASDLKIIFTVLEGEQNNKVKVLWTADYTFSATGKKVHNIVSATFNVENGLIQSHRDEFNLWRWSQQSLGIIGWLWGWSPFFRISLQTKTNKLLQSYEIKCDTRNAK